MSFFIEKVEIMKLNNDKALVVFSGGQDSTTCMFHALKHYREVELVTFSYGQRHALEIEVATNIAAEQGLKHHVLDMSLLSQLSPNALTDHSMAIEDGDIPNTFVPARNLLFMSFAAALAYQISAKHIITGVCETDFSRLSRLPRHLHQVSERHREPGHG